MAVVVRGAFDAHLNRDALLSGIILIANKPSPAVRVILALATLLGVQRVGIVRGVAFEV